MQQADLNDTILSQYANSPVLLALVQCMNAAIDPAQNFARFYADVWDIYTAKTWGLDNWGRILGVSRLLQVDDTGATFGFLGSTLQPFGQGTFAHPATTNTYALTDDAYRALLLLKAAANISNCSIPSLNSILQNMLAGRGAAYVLEVGTMRIRYVFEFWLTAYERALLTRSGVAPKPSGVGYEILEIDPPNTFGFAGSGLQSFNNGMFKNGGPINGN